MKSSDLSKLTKDLPPYIWSTEYFSGELCQYWLYIGPRRTPGHNGGEWELGYQNNDGQYLGHAATGHDLEQMVRVTKPLWAAIRSDHPELEELYEE
jgi:hypothetical protein